MSVTSAEMARLRELQRRLHPTVHVERPVADQKIATAEHKVPLDLLPLAALKGVARVFGYGAKKYRRWNWYAADDTEIGNRYVGGLLRHICGLQNPSGEFDFASLAARDEESGLPHIDHAICGLLMLRGQLVKAGVLPDDPGCGNEPTRGVTP